jgi:tRNA pseudouridine55 synthase
MAFLLRTRAGAFDIRDAVTLDELQPDVGAALTPMDEPLMHLSEVHVDPSREKWLLNGNPVPLCDLDRIPPPGEPVRVYLNGAFVAVGQADEDRLRLRTMLSGPQQ